MTQHSLITLFLSFYMQNINDSWTNGYPKADLGNLYTGWQHKIKRTHVVREFAFENCNGFVLLFLVGHEYRVPITVAERPNAWTVFPNSNAEIVGSNPTQGRDVYVRLFCVCVVLRVDSGLATGWSPVQGVLPTVYKIKKLKKRPRSNKRTLEA
jgi:hypothetical protein